MASRHKYDVSHRQNGHWEVKQQRAERVSGYSSGRRMPSNADVSWPGRNTASCSSAARTVASRRNTPTATISFRRRARCAMLVPKYFVQPGQPHPVSEPAFAIPLAAPAPNPWGALLAAGLIVRGICAAVDLFSPQPAPRLRRRLYRAEPVSIADKEYISVRDCWQCVYCGRRVTRGSRHIDHSVSRVNGGTNHLNNLRLACAKCNLAKGPLNSREFRRSFR